MTFPNTLLGTKVEIFYDGDWHDIVKDTPLGATEPNSRVRGLGAVDGDINISPRGQADESSGLQPTQATFAVNNRDGKYSPRNTLSDLYGKIGTNTPCRIATDLCDTLSIVDTFSGTRSNTWGVTDTSGHTWTNTTTGSANDFDVSGGTGTHAHTANSLPHFSSVNTTVGGEALTITDVDVVVDGISVSAAPATDNIEVGWRARTDASDTSYVEARLLFNPSNTILIAVREVVSSAETATTGFAAVAGLTAADTVSFRFQVVGYTIRMRAWETGTTEPTTWQQTLTVAHVTPGRVRLFSNVHAGNTTTKPLSVSFGNVHASLGIILFTGEIVEWPKRWDSTGTDVWVPVTAAGITRRKRQGNRPTRSTLYNFVRKELGSSFLGLIGNVHHYWPLENLSQQTRDIRCDMDGRTLLRFDVAEHNTVEWSSNDFLVGSDKLVTITGLPIPEGVVIVPFISAFDAPPLGDPEFETPPVESPDAWAFMCWFYLPPLLEDFPFLPATSLYFSFAVPDSDIDNVFVDIQYRPDTNTIQGTLDSTSGDLTDGPVTMAYTDEPHLLLIRWFTDGSDETSFSATVDTTTLVSDTASFRPFAHCRRFTIEIEPYSPVTIGHLALETGSGGTFLGSEGPDLPHIGEGRPGDTAVERFERVVATEGLAYQVFEGELDADFPTELGPQASGNFIDYLDDIKLADDGIIYELRNEFGYGFKTRQSLYTADATLELDYTATDLAEVPEVTEDDQLTRNIVRVKRRGGTQGEVTSVITGGPLGTDNAGDYEEGTIEVALNDEDQLADYAAFRTFKGTWDEDRWPSVTVYLHRAPFANNITKLIKALLLEIGDIISTVNKPVWLGGDVDDLLLQMRSVEIRLSNFEIELTWNLIPGGPYASLAGFDEVALGRLETTESTLLEAVDTTETTLIVHTELTETPDDTPLWTTDPAEYDMWGFEGIDFRLNPPSRAGGRGGEKVTVGVLAPVVDTFTRAGAQLAGTNADTGQTWVSSLGTATDTVLNGSAAVSTHTSANTNCWNSVPVGTFDMSVSATVTFNFSSATGAAFFVEVIVRQTDTLNNYRARVSIAAGGAAVVLQPLRILAGAGTFLVSDIPIGTNVSGVPIHIKASVVGRAFRCKAWLSTNDEPDWLYEGFDAARDIINGTDAGIRSSRPTGNTNVNASATWDNVQIHTPKIYPYVWDRFNRTVLNDPTLSAPNQGLGQTYSWFSAGAIAATAFDFTPNQLAITLTDSNAYGAVYLADIDLEDAVASVVWTIAQATGASLEPGCIMMRGTGLTSYVLFRVAVTTGNAVNIEINSAAGASLGTYSTGITHAGTGTPLKTKAACYGDKLMMKCWNANTTAEPDWQLVVTDPAPTSGWIGLRAGRAASNTNTNPPATFHQFEVSNPQRFTVVRSANGIVKSWPAGTDVSLHNPMRLSR